MKKVFITQPMFGKTNEQIREERMKIKQELESMGYEVLDSIIEEDSDNPVYLLSKSIEILSQADCICLMQGWEKGRGCRIEKEIADAYNIPILREV